MSNLNLVLPIEDVSTNLHVSSPHDISTNLIHDISTNLIRDISTNLIHDISTNLIRDISTNLIHDVSTNLIRDISTNLIHDISTNLIRDISTNLIHDVSTNIIITGSTNISFCSDLCFNIIDISSLLLYPSDISINAYDISFVNGMKIITETGFSHGKFISETAAITIDPSNDVQIVIDLSAVVQQYNHAVDISINSIMQEISMYAGKINCSDFQGKGTVDDYMELFQAASDMAKHAKQTTLNINIDRFKEFGNAADELSALFQNYIVKIENINVINDMAFLSEMLFYLKKIWNLSETFGKFKDTILGTSIIKIPKSLEDTRNIIDGVMSEVDCAMKYIECFISPEKVADISLCCPGSYELDTDDKYQIMEAVKTIQKWNYLYNDNIQIAISENADVQFIENANEIIKNTANIMKNNTAILKGKIKIFSCKK
jgi:citrate lyase gamma subunit